MFSQNTLQLLTVCSSRISCVEVSLYLMVPYEFFFHGFVWVHVSFSIPSVLH